MPTPAQVKAISTPGIWFGELPRTARGPDDLVHARVYLQAEARQAERREGFRRKRFRASSDGRQV